MTHWLNHGPREQFGSLESLKCQAGPMLSCVSPVSEGRNMTCNKQASCTGSEREPQRIDQFLVIFLGLHIHLHPPHTCLQEKGIIFNINTCSKLIRQLISLSLLVPDNDKERSRFVSKLLPSYLGCSDLH